MSFLRHTSGILEGEGETRSSIEPAGRSFPTRQSI